MIVSNHEQRLMPMKCSIVQHGVCLPTSRSLLRDLLYIARSSYHQARLLRLCVHCFTRHVLAYGPYAFSTESSCGRSCDDLQVFWSVLFPATSANPSLVLRLLIREPLPGRHKLSQLVPDHLFCYIHLLVDLPIMHRKSETNEIW
jgi:hypothetical protein